MPILIVLAGSVAGFIAGLLGWLAFDLSLLTGMAIWIGSGPVSALIATALSAPSGPAQARPADQTLAEV